MGKRLLAVFVAGAVQFCAAMAVLIIIAPFVRVLPGPLFVVVVGPGALLGLVAMAIGWAKVHDWVLRKLN